MLKKFIDGTEPDYGETCDAHFKAKVCSASKDIMVGMSLPMEYCPAETITEQVLVRRPIEYNPPFPSDPYPEDWKYGVYEDVPCAIHSQPLEPIITLPLPTPTPAYVPFRPY